MPVSTLPVIVVFGATGTVCSAFCRAVSSADHPRFRLRALTRDTKSPAAQRLAALPNVELRTVDHSNDDGIKHALDGVTRVLFCFSVPFDPTNADVVRRWLRLAGAQLEAVVYISAMAADLPLYGRVHLECEEAVARSGVPYAILRCISFMQNFVTPALKPFTGINNGRFVSMTGDARYAWIDARDIADCAVRILTAPKAELGRLTGRRYNLTGGEMTSNAELAAKLSQHFHRSVEYVDMPPREWRQWLMDELHFPEYVADVIVEGVGFVRDGKASFVSPDVQSIMGSPPRGWEQFLNDYGEEVTF